MGNDLLINRDGNHRLHAIGGNNKSSHSNISEQNEN